LNWERFNRRYGDWDFISSIFTGLEKAGLGSIVAAATGKFIASFSPGLEKLIFTQISA